MQEKEVILGMVKTPPVVRLGKDTFPVHTKIKRLFALDIVMEKDVACYRTLHEKAQMWHRRLGHCNAKALRHLAECPETSVRIPSNLEAVSKCTLCSISRRKK